MALCSIVYDDSMQMRIVAGATVAVVFVLVLGELKMHTKKEVVVLFYICIHLFAVIVATVLFFRSKNQDDLDKKTNNHLPLPLDYASNEGTNGFDWFAFFCIFVELVRLANRWSRKCIHIRLHHVPSSIPFLNMISIANTATLVARFPV